jgi:hypothetical protein
MLGAVGPHTLLQVSSLIGNRLTQLRPHLLDETAYLVRTNHLHQHLAYDVTYSTQMCIGPLEG